jgi:hypothetical protein
MKTIAYFLVNIALAAAIVALYATMQQLDEQPAADTLATQDAIQTEAARARFARAAAQSCGNADWVEVDATTVRCLPRKTPANTGAIVALAEVSQ